MSGRIIGKQNDPTSSVASGIWSLQEQYLAEKQQLWPHLPVQTDLVIFLDASRSDSYSGSGTTWTDLSGGDDNGTITGATHDANGGRFLFDAGTEVVDFTTYETHKSTTFTIELWALPTATHEIDTQATSGTTGTSGQKYILEAQQEATNSGCGISLGTNGVSVYGHGNAFMPPLLVEERTINTKTQIVVTVTSGVPSLYINGSFVKTGSTNPRTMYGGFLELGNGIYGAYEGYLYKALFYDRVLTASEILYNYNALGR